MPAIVNLADFVKVGILAFLFIWGANKALDTLNKPEYKVV